MFKFIRNLFNKKEDDGIDFQWGDRYIRAHETIPGFGGKYWRRNSDGTITQYTPYEIKVKSTIRYFVDSELKPKRISFNKVIFNDEKHAIKVENDINSSNFSKARGISLERSGKIITVLASKEVFESTYTPGGGI